MRMSRLLVALVLLAGCRVHLTEQRKPPAAADAVARRFLHLLAAGDVPGATALLGPQANLAGTVQGLNAVAATLRGRFPDSLVAVHNVSRKADDRWFYELDYESRAGDQWVVFSVLVRAPAARGQTPDMATQVATAGYTIGALRETWLPQSLQQSNALTLKGKTPAHYLLLLFCLASVLFILYTIVLIFRTPGVRHLLWALLSLVAVGNLQMNWTTGQSRFVATAIVLLGASVGRPDLASPWVVTVGFPLGAMLFHSRHLIQPFWRRRPKGEAPPEQGSAAEGENMPGHESAPEQERAPEEPPPGA
jgi:hypothetical protein